MKLTPGHLYLCRDGNVCEVIGISKSHTTDRPVYVDYYNYNARTANHITRRTCDMNGMSRPDLKDSPHDLLAQMPPTWSYNRVIPAEFIADLVSDLNSSAIACEVRSVQKWLREAREGAEKKAAEKKASRRKTSKK